MSFPVDAGASAKKRFECTYCEYATSTKQILGRHIAAVHLQLEQFQCTNCPLAFGFYSTWKTHQLRCKHVHRSEQLYACDKCSATFARRHDIPLHYLESHRPEEVRCDICDKLFRSQFSLQQHTWRFHPKTPHVCSSCRMEFQTRAHLRTHDKTVHPSKRKRKRVGKMTQSDGWSMQNADGSFICDNCGNTILRGSRRESKGRFYSIRARERMMRHVLECQLKVPYKCPSCNSNQAQFDTKSALRQHQRAMHGFDKTVVCDDCSTCFARSNALRYHLSTQHHTTEIAVRGESEIYSRFYCDQCNRPFVDSNRLAKHISDYWISCKICGWQANTKACLIDRDSTRERTKWYRLKLQMALNRHCRKSHKLMENRYVCNQCSRSFTLKERVAACILRHFRCKQKDAIAVQRAMQKNVGVICGIVPMKAKECNTMNEL